MLVHATWSIKDGSLIPFIAYETENGKNMNRLASSDNSALEAGIEMLKTNEMKATNAVLFYENEEDSLLIAHIRSYSQPIQGIDIAIEFERGSWLRRKKFKIWEPKLM